MAGSDDNSSTSDDWLLWTDAIAFVARLLRKEAAAENFIIAAEDFIVEALSEGRITYPFGYTADFECQVSEGSVPLTFASVHHWFWRWSRHKDLDLKIDRDRSSAIRTGSIIKARHFNDDGKPHSFWFDPRGSMTLQARWITLRRSVLVRCLSEAGFMPWPLPVEPNAESTIEPAAAPASSPSSPASASSQRKTAASPPKETAASWTAKAAKRRPQLEGEEVTEWADRLLLYERPSRNWSRETIANELYILLRPQNGS
jgi:hypothetical protein